MGIHESSKGQNSSLLSHHSLCSCSPQQGFSRVLQSQFFAVWCHSFLSALSEVQLLGTTSRPACLASLPGQYVLARFTLLPVAVPLFPPSFTHFFSVKLCPSASCTSLSFVSWTFSSIPRLNDSLSLAYLDWCGLGSENPLGAVSQPSNISARLSNFLQPLAWLPSKRPTKSTGIFVRYGTGEIDLAVSICLGSWTVALGWPFRLSPTVRPLLVYIRTTIPPGGFVQRAPAAKKTD